MRLYVCLCACKSANSVCVLAYILACLCFQMCAHVCLYLCVLAEVTPVAITAHRHGSLLWSLTCQHPAGHVVHLHTVSLCSLGTCSHTKQVHFCICMCLYACVCLLQFHFVCVREFASQTSGRSSTYGCYLPLPPAFSQTETSLCQMSC